MKNIFGEIVNAPAVKLPVTTRDRAAKLAAKIAAKTPAPFDVSKYNISSFPRPEVQSAFIGQNLYIKPSYVVSMPEYCFFNRFTGEVVTKNPRTLTENFIKNQENLKNNETNGELSRKAVTGLRNSINWLCLAATKKRVFVRKENKNFFFKVNFVTMTLPDTDQEITPADLQKKLLNPFLTYFRQFYGLRNYVWRLEFQKNGKLHVHLTCDTFLHHRLVRDTWNRLLDKHGYLEKFFKDNRHRDPNSTDVHATRKVKDMAAYLSKYMSKKGKKAEGEEEEKKILKGRIWGCSRELSRANKTTLHVPAPDCAQELKCFMDREIPYKEITAGPAKNSNYISPYAAPGILEQPKKIGEVYFLKASDWANKITGKARDLFDETRRMIARAGDQMKVFELT